MSEWAIRAIKNNRICKLCNLTHNYSIVLKFLLLIEHYCLVTIKNDESDGRFSTCGSVEIWFDDFGQKS
jgi:hypothetical protein